jgi:hypothetical protein
MSTQVIDRMAGEDTNLALHVQLCEQRYIQLITKLDQVDTALDEIRITLITINAKLDKEESTKLRTYLGWAGVLIVSLLGAVLHLVTR